MDLQQIVFLVLDTLIRIMVPVITGFLVNFLIRKIGRERFLLSKDIVASIVSTIEQQYRSGEIPKDDRFALALKQGIKRTGLKEEQVAMLIKEAVFLINLEIGKYAHPQQQKTEENSL